MIDRMLLCSYESNMIRLEEASSALELLRKYFDKTPKLDDPLSYRELIEFHEAHKSLLNLIVDRIDQIVADSQEAIEQVYEEREGE